jgi:hypothetical protein
MTATLLIHNQFRLNLPERQLSSSILFLASRKFGIVGTTGYHRIGGTRVNS